MIVDANVLLRALDQSDGEQTAAVHARIRAARASSAPLTVMAATVLEVAYVLQSSRTGYGWDRDTVARAVEAIVDEPGFVVEHGDALRAAAARHRERAIDLHDCFLDALAVQRGVRVLSFDHDLLRLGSGEVP